jgi:hypothetical protein
MPFGICRYTALEELELYREQTAMAKAQFLAVERELHSARVRFGRAEREGNRRFARSIHMRISVLEGFRTAYVLYLVKKEQQIQDTNEQLLYSGHLA